MIPNETRQVLGTSHALIRFDKQEVYYIDASTLVHFEVLMRRLGTERTMGADEMRDWMNYLFSVLRRVSEINDRRGVG